MTQSNFIKNILILLALAFGVWFVWAIRNVILYMIVAAVVGLIASPTVRILSGLHIGRFRVPNTMAVISVMISMILIFVGVIAMFVPMITSQAHNLALLDATTTKQNVILIYDNIMNLLQSYGVIDKIPQITTDYLSSIDFSFIPNFVNSVVSSFGSLMTLIFSVAFFAFFFLKDRNTATGFILSIVPDDIVEKTSNTIQKTRNLLSRYLIGLLIQQTLIFIAVLILLLAFGIENPFIIAFLVALLNIIPYIGPLLGGVILVSLSMLCCIGTGTQDIFSTSLWILCGFVAIQMVDNFVSQPIIFSNSVNAHPLEIFTATLIGGTLFGITGMIIAVPSYTLIRIIAKEFLSEFKIVRVMTKNL